SVLLVIPSRICGQELLFNIHAAVDLCMNVFPMRGSADRVGRDSSLRKPALGMTRRDLDAYAVFGAVEHAIVARVAVALIRSATGEALFAKFVAEIERASDYAETDAGPHKHQKWTPNA